MRQIQKRMLLQILVGFILGRVVIFGLNPVAPAYFAVSFLAGGAVIPVGLATVLGMMTNLAAEQVAVYGASMLVLWLVADFCERRKAEYQWYHLACLLAVSTLVMELTKLVVIPYSMDSVVYVLCEAVLIFFLTSVLKGGVDFLLHGNSSRLPEQEEWISLGILFGACILGLPNQTLASLTITQLVIYIALLLFGYCLGGKQVNGKEESTTSKYLQHKLQDFSESFYNLGKAMSNYVVPFQMSRHEMRDLMGEVSNQVCDRCEQREYCMGQLELTKGDFYGNLAFVQEQGVLEASSFPKRFLQECIHLDRIVEQTNQNLQLFRMEMGARNRMCESRKVMANQMEEVGKLVAGLADQMEEHSDISQDAKIRIMRHLQARRVKATGIMFYEKKDGRLEVHMRAKTIRGRLVTANAVAAILREVLEKPMRVSEQSRQLVSREMSYFVFEEEPLLKAVTGIARQAKEGEDISGDVFTCLALSSGETLIALADGMGSGPGAFEDSRTVIELLEQMSDAGFSHTSALKLINTVYLTCAQAEHYVTADILILNLFRGECQFIKNSATATYLYHDSSLEKIEGQALPIGAISELDSYFVKGKISEGDYVIMMTDGVADCFCEGENSLEYYLEECGYLEPDVLSDAILEEAIFRNNGHVFDDMSVIVTKIEER